MSEKSCANCIHGSMCSLRRAVAEANRKCNIIVLPNDLAKICFEYREKEEMEDE